MLVALNVSENGEFLITALYSYGFPLINYKVGDCGEISEIQPSAGDTIPFTSATLRIGRITDNFLTSESEIVSSSALGAYLSTFNFSNSRATDYTGTAIRKFTVNYVPDMGLIQSYYYETVHKVFSEYFGSNVGIKFNEIKQIEVEASGKKLMYKRTFDLV